MIPRKQGKMGWPGFWVVIVYLAIGSVPGDVIITTKGDEITGRIVSVDDTEVNYVAADASSEAAARTIPVRQVFMLKYDDGRKQVFGPPKNGREDARKPGKGNYGIGLFLETGLFGLVNSNEEFFDPGVVTLGVTPSIDRRLNRFLSLGVEYMILWAKAPGADDSRFIMNCNGLLKVAFSISGKLDFLAEVGAGLSLWPGAESDYANDSTFFMDRIGWDLHGGIGLQYAMHKNSSIVLSAGYNANFTTLQDIPITVDMLLVSIGPRIEF